MIFHNFFKFFDILNDLRLHVIFNYLLLVSWFLYGFKVSVESAVEYAFLSMCMLGAAYLYNRYTDYDYDVIADAGLAKVNRPVYLYFSAFFLAMGLTFWALNDVYPLPIFVGLIFGFVYSSKSFLKYPFKNYLIVKNITAVLPKCIVTFGGLLFFISYTDSVFYKGISMVCFYLIYEILWDVRDIQADIVGKVKTLPNTIGKNWSLVVCLLIWVISLSSQYFFVNHTDYFYIKYVVVLSFIVSLFIVNKVRWYHLMTYTHMVLNLIFINNEVLLYIKSFLTEGF